ncbi:unnamed protein product [Ilex paraguariensis]|uniref:DEAD-box ATP-dependent RNA helicase 33 n=1 Tax=Ilex paraguariensis TaxID=185542 RepID=A0ABC8TUM6_9AQUA
MFSTNPWDEWIWILERKAQTTTRRVTVQRPVVFIFSFSSSISFQRLGLQSVKMSFLQTSLPIPTPPRSLSSSKVLSGPTHIFLTYKFSHLSLTTTITPNIPLKTTTTIRMGGGPRTYPGGVSKWQWKRMQQKKAKQLLKARLARERSIYEMRKRAELKAAVSELERPWEVVEKAPTLFSVSADEQVKVLADRFQMPGGFDLWSERDGPQLFETVDEIPSARFFPKGVVHSIKPYGKIDKDVDVDELGNSNLEGEMEGKMRVNRNGYDKNSRNLRGDLYSEGNVDDLGLKKSKVLLNEAKSGKGLKGKFRKNEKRRKYMSDSEGLGSGEGDLYQRKDRSIRELRDSDAELSMDRGLEEFESSNSEVYDMSLQHDGSYRFAGED